MSSFFSWQHAFRASKLESTTKLVCYTIWSHMASDGTGCFPSYALIAEESGLSRRSVIEHVQKAARAGFLVVDSRQRENGSASSNFYRPTMPVGSEPAALGGERGSLGGGERAAPPEETTLSNKSHNTPHTPKGAGYWETDSLFMKLCEAYATHNASRVDFGKAWEVWSQQGLAEHADALLVALGEFVKLDQWRKEGGKFIPRLSKWLADGSWRSHSKISKVVTGEELASRSKIVKAGQDAWARMETAKRMGWDPDPDDIEAFQAWKAVVKQI